MKTYLCPDKNIFGHLHRYLKDLVKKNTNKGEYYFFEEVSKTIKLETILEKSLSDSLSKFSWKKSMRWESRK